MRLPSYQSFLDTTIVLDLSLSCSSLHGTICGFLCASEPSEGERYLRSFMVDSKNPEVRSAILALFDIFTISQQQISDSDLSFQLFLPDDHAPITDRIQAFSEWCAGFVEGLAMAGVEIEDLEDEESQEAFNHLKEFSELSPENLESDDEDEKALMEVSEYTRMTVLRLHMDLQAQGNEGKGQQTH
jgi:uncharacterized protein YgfB (UPF0149 family)